MLVFDDVLADPHAYRAMALQRPYADVPLGDHVFKGIALCQDPTIPLLIESLVPGAHAQLSFFRQSPAGQIEPNFIHSDESMGNWTGIFYLSPESPPADGTSFWRHKATGAQHGTAWINEGHDTGRWERWHHVEAKFNRLLVFESSLLHSRGLLENFGQDEDARLIQVTFATGGRLS